MAKKKRTKKQIRADIEANIKAYNKAVLAHKKTLAKLDAEYEKLNVEQSELED